MVNSFLEQGCSLGATGDGVSEHLVCLAAKPPKWQWPSEVGGGQQHSPLHRNEVSNI